MNLTPSVVPLRVVFSVRIERCAGCNTMAWDTLDRTYGRALSKQKEAIAPADDTDDPNHWQWRCKCGTLNVTRVDPS